MVVVQVWRKVALEEKWRACDGCPMEDKTGCVKSGTKTLCAEHVIARRA
jgi:hypothetical protein